MGHVYTVLSAHLLKHKGKDLKLIKCRNPWGNTEWKGAWSDDSNLWTDDLKEQVGFTAENDGTFFISYDDFRKNFVCSAICYVEDLH